jgi:hypothetical protein
MRKVTPILLGPSEMTNLNRWATHVRVRVRVRVTLRLRVSQLSCLSVEPTLWKFHQILLRFQEFESGICCPVSVECPL